MKVTVDMIMGKTPCEEWTRERVEEQIGEGKTLLEILDLDIEARGRIWAVTRFLPDEINRAFAIWCARQCKPDVSEIREYIDTIERYYAGEATKEELEAADRAAGSAADSAADRDAYSAAYSAAYWAAYSAVAWAAAGGAAQRAADGAEMRQRQIDKLKQMIKEGEND